MNPLLILAAVGGLGALLLGGKKSTPATAPKTAPPLTLPTIVITKPTPTGTTEPVPTVPTVPIPTLPVKVVLPIPSTTDYPTFPASGNLDPLLTESEKFELANYNNDQLYQDAMVSGHLAFVAAAGGVLASKGDTRAADLTLRVANWGK